MRADDNYYFKAPTATFSSLQFPCQACALCTKTTIVDKQLNLNAKSSRHLLSFTIKHNNHKTLLPQPAFLKSKNQQSGGKKTVASPHCPQNNQPIPSLNESCYQSSKCDWLRKLPNLVITPSCIPGLALLPPKCSSTCN